MPDLDMTVVITAGAYDDNSQTATHRINALFQEIISTLVFCAVTFVMRLPG